MKASSAVLLIAGIFSANSLCAQRTAPPGPLFWEGNETIGPQSRRPQPLGGPVDFLDFEGMLYLEQVLEYYNGGFGSLGSGPGPGFGVSLGSNGLALNDGNYSNNPSPPSILFWLSGPNTFLNKAAGFSDSVAMSYASSVDGSISLHSEINGGGTVIATIPLIATPSLPPGTPYYNNWRKIVVPFAGIAKSISFGGTANNIAFDDVVLGGETFTCGQLLSVVGAWDDSTGTCGDMTSNAVSARYESALLDVPPPPGDYYRYSVDFVQNRVQERTAATTLMVHGAPYPLQGAAQWWNRMLAFNISGDGKYSIYRYNGTARPAVVQKWTPIIGTAVAASPASNTLAVEYDGTNLAFELNGVTLRIIPTAFTVDQFGVGFVRSRSTTGDLSLDDWLKIGDAGIQIFLGAPRSAVPPVSAAQAAANARANLQPGDGNPMYSPATTKGGL